MRFSKKQKMLFGALVLILIISLASDASLAFLWHKKNLEYQKAKNDAQKEIPALSIQTPFNDSLEIKQTSFPDTVCNIAEYGAVGDGQTMNTKAFSEAIDNCAKQGGGEVLVPEGTWLTGAIHLKSNINLHLDKNAEILFSTNFNDYLPVVLSRHEGVEYYNYSPAIYAVLNKHKHIRTVG